MPWLNLSGQVFSFDRLLTDIDSERLGVFERTALSFCKAWLSGQSEFTIQTSGSTGAPKPITFHRSQMEASARQTINALGLKAGETALVCLDTQYIAGQMMLVRSLLSGMNILLAEPSSNPFAKIKNHRIDFTAMVPYQLDAVLNETPEKLNSLRCVIIGGATIGNLLKEKIKSCSCEILATYGMTETISHIALQGLNGLKAQEYFEALPNIGLRLDERGCLCIKADYLKEEIVTNDLVELTDNRKFKWLGRIDNVINSGGIKIIPEKIESVFEKIFDHHQIKSRFFAAGLPHNQLGQQITLIVEGNRFDKSTQEKIVAQAGKQLSKYELPKEFKFINIFRQTTTGKINRPSTLALL